MLWAIWHRVCLYAACGFFIGISYIQVIFFAENLHKQTASTLQEKISIRQILKEGEHRAAVAMRENGEQIYLVWQSDTPLQLRDYQAELRLRPLATRLNEGNFNRQRWYIARHISATAVVKQAELMPNQSIAWRTERLEKVLSQTNRLTAQGLIISLAFGERAWLEQSHWQLFQQTATAHLIAISGLHIALAFGIGFWLGKLLLWCGRKYAVQAVQNPHFFAMVIGFLFAWGYSYLAGFSLPTLRAILALSTVLLCRLARRHYTSWQFWWRVVTLLIVLDPLSLLSDSFWLSVLAVAALIFWYRTFPLKHFPHLDEWQKRKKWRGFLVKLLHLQIGISLCFLPVQFFFFEGSSPYAFPANLLIVPYYSFVVVPLILFSLLSDNLLSTWWLVDWLILQSLTLLEPLAGQWEVFSHSAQWRWICFDLLLLALLYFRHKLRSHFSVIVVSFAGLYQGGNLWQQSWKEPELTWIHFDVGQGLAMAFIYREGERKYAVLYDTGAGWQGGSMAELEIIPYLKRYGITPIALVVSHEDNDHAGGVLPILREFPNIRLILSGRNRYDNRPFEPCIAGQGWKFGTLYLQAHYPFELATQAENEHSCVLLAKIGNHRLLLTGDSGVPQERQFAAKIGKIDFLQVGHHGSKTSTGYTLLAQTTPDWAIISASRFNPWKMPSLSVTSRLDELGVKWRNTAREGMIQVKFYTEGYDIRSMRGKWQAWYSGYFEQ